MIKNIIILSLLAINFYVVHIWADVANELKIRLNKINSFSANFEHKITDVNGYLIQQGKGKIYVKRPNLFNWHMILPDESWLISDGKNLWFYDPLVEQVTVTLLSTAIKDTLFMFITDNDLHNWKHHLISQHGDDFLLKKRQNTGKLKYFSINIQSNGIIRQFATIEQDGQTNTYCLKNYNNSIVDSNKFKFVIPHGVIVDDQRIKEQ